MKQFARIFIVVLLELACMSGCEKPEVTQESDVPQAETPAVESPICTYRYDGTEYPVYSVTYAANETQMLIRISPFKEGEKQTTYAVIGINAALEGVEIDVAKAWHNDDYYFIYEDPVMYYSQYRHLQSGKIMLKRDGPDAYKVFVDVTLPDGKSFKFSL